MVVVVVAVCRCLSYFSRFRLECGASALASNCELGPILVAPVIGGVFVVEYGRFDRYYSFQRSAWEA